LKTIKLPLVKKISNTGHYVSMHQHPNNSKNYEPFIPENSPFGFHAPYLRFHKLTANTGLKIKATMVTLPV
jgi:hypothetical protein